MIKSVAKFKLKIIKLEDYKNIHETVSVTVEIQYFMCLLLVSQPSRLPGTPIG